jgi:hypothetical protein
VSPSSGPIALIMEAVSISETSVNFYEGTRRNIPEDSSLHTRHRENLKPQFVLPFRIICKLQCPIYLDLNAIEATDFLHSVGHVTPFALRNRSAS